MALTYPIDVTATAGRWYLYDTVTQNLAKMTSGTGNWPNADGSEIAGLAANLVPILATDDPQPTIDSRLQRLEGNFDPPDVENNSMVKKWSIIPRSKPEKKDVVHNIEQEELSKHFDFNRLLLETVLIQAAIIRSIKNLNVPAPLQTMADNYQAKAEKIYNNRLIINQLLQQIDADEDIDLDQEFAPVE